MSSNANRRSIVEALIRSLLTNRLAMAIKRRVRDARWQRAGVAFTNPAPPAVVHNIVFVCLGNICRSPFAAALSERRLAPQQTRVRFLSAGLDTKQSNKPPAAAVHTARRYGCDLDGHRPLPVTESMIAASDMVVAMEMRHIEELTRRWPHWRHRYFLLPLFDPKNADAGAFDRYNLADPFGKNDAEFARCYERIDGAVAGLLQQLAVGASRDGS